MTRSPLLVGLDVSLVVAIHALAFAFVSSSLLAAWPGMLGLAVAIDLVVTASVIHWFAGVRGAGLPRWTVSIVALLGALSARLMVPDSGSMILLGALLGAVELGLGAFATWRLVTLWREARRARTGGEDVLGALEAGLARALESRVLASAVVAELELIALGVVGVFRRAPRGHDVFTVHREAAWIPVALTLMALSLVEIPVLHWLAGRFVGEWLAWGLTAASVYGLVWLWGDAQAMRLRPMRIRDGVWSLRVGLRWRGEIPLHLVVDAVQDSESEDAEALVLGVFGATNVRVELRQPVVVHGLFGIRREARRLRLQVDDVPGFLRAVRAVDPD